MKQFLIFVLILFSIPSVKSQVLISLVFGDKLNSPNIEFGLDGGLTLSTIDNLKGAEYKDGFNLGFYFDFKLKNPAWMINTGVLVKSPMGAENIPIYNLNDTHLDSLFIGGNVERNLGYFQIPINLKYMFKSNIFVKGGIQLALMNKAYDEFSNQVDGQELTYKISNRDSYHAVDAGLCAGVGYRLMGGNGMNLSATYFYGLRDVLKENSGDALYNRSFYFTVGIPIGRGKALSKEDTKNN